MANEVPRIMKMSKCLNVRFSARDIDGDHIFVDIEGPAAQDILDYLKRGIATATVSPALSMLKEPT